MGVDIEAIAKDVVDAAFKVHKQFEPGLLSLLIRHVMCTNFANAAGLFKLN